QAEGVAEDLRMPEGHLGREPATVGIAGDRAILPDRGEPEPTLGPRGDLLDEEGLMVGEPPRVDARDVLLGAQVLAAVVVMRALRARPEIAAVVDADERDGRDAPGGDQRLDHPGERLDRLTIADVHDRARAGTVMAGWEVGGHPAAASQRHAGELGLL